ncbi:MAG: hypothetical protein ACPG4T_10385 [Nannocystaceae bacterium]
MRGKEYFDNVGILVDGRKSPDERLSTVMEGFEDLNDERAEDAAERIVAQMEGVEPGQGQTDPQKVTIAKEAVKTLRSGDWMDVVGIGFAGLIGATAGGLSHRVVDISPGNVPVNGLLVGVAGVGAGIALDQLPLSVRGVAAAFGAGFLAGSMQWVRQHPDITIAGSTTD